MMLYASPNLPAFSLACVRCVVKVGWTEVISVRNKPVSTCFAACPGLGITDLRAPKSLLGYPYTPFSSICPSHPDLCTQVELSLHHHPGSPPLASPRVHPIGGTAKGWGVGDGLFLMLPCLRVQFQQWFCLSCIGLQLLLHSSSTHNTVFCPCPSHPK